MKRLKRQADSYYGKQYDLNDWKNLLQRAAEECCGMCGMNPNTIKIDMGDQNTTVVIGDLDSEGYELSIAIYNIISDQRINRIIYSIGHNRYIETREQSILDAFLSLNGEFYNWVENAMNKLEEKYC